MLLTCHVHGRLNGAVRVRSLLVELTREAERRLNGLLQACVSERVRLLQRLAERAVRDASVTRRLRVVRLLAVSCRDHAHRDLHLLRLRVLVQAIGDVFASIFHFLVGELLRLFVDVRLFLQGQKIGVSDALLS